MARVCRMCRRVNPIDARYCYNDGVALDTAAGWSPPIAVGALKFRSVFVFPSGLNCHSLDELVLACEENWVEATEVLRRGYLETFFGSLGRTDLARAAHQAAKVSDADRGLDEFLAKLPASTRQPAQLVVRPTEINLGSVGRDRDHHIMLDLSNGGMGLVFGSIRGVDCDWLSVGDGSGINRKMFQFRQELRLTLRVLGRCLRAGNKPLEGRLEIESNAGAAVVLVRLEVPARPFPGGVLAGALTPRDVAVKAKAAVKEAAGLFENGAVAAWYESNGWIYPVGGPPASGMGAVQQFFEALGLTRPPRVEILTPTIEFQGAVGAALSNEIRLQTVDKRPVFASCVSSAPWLKIGKPLLERQTARIPLEVAQVPALPGQNLQAQATVTANGNQHFTVEVRLRITSHGESGNRTPMPPVGEPTYYAVVPPFRVQSWPSQPEHESAPPVARAVVLDVGDYPEALPVMVPSEQRSREVVRDAEAVEDDEDERGDIGKAPFWPHLLPTLALALGLLVTLGHDLIVGAQSPSGNEGGGEALDSRPRLGLEFHDVDLDVIEAKDGVKGEGAHRGKEWQWKASMRFGLTMLEPSQDGLPLKRLTFSDHGFQTSNVVVSVDGRASIFGESPYLDLEGKADARPTGHWKQMIIPIPDTVNSVQGRESQWILHASKVEVSQRVEIVRGAQSQLLDTCLIRYRMTNQDSKPHQVGIRYLLDTYIGGNDGVPFLIPGALALCSTQKVFEAQDIPQFIQACESENLAKPGTIVQVGLKVSPLESPNRVTLGAYPDGRMADPLCRQERTLWFVPVKDIHTLPPGDSCVVLYWNERKLMPGETREVGFTYGLGNVASSDGAGKLGISVGGSFTPNGEFTVTAQVSNPTADQSVTLKLPTGFRLIDGAAMQPVPKLPPNSQSHISISPVTWKVKASQSEGTYQLEVESSSGLSQQRPIRIQTRGIFGE